MFNRNYTAGVHGLVLDWFLQPCLLPWPHKSRPANFYQGLSRNAECLCAAGLVVARGIMAAGDELNRPATGSHSAALEPEAGSNRIPGGKSIQPVPGDRAHHG